MIIRRARKRRPALVSLLLFFFCASLPAGSDVILNAVVLADPSLFSAPLYERVLAAYGNASVLSVQADLITGTEAKRAYFPNRTSIYAFQLLHITRVQASVQSHDNPNTTARLGSSFGAACLAAGVGVVAIDSILIASSSPLDVVMQWIASLPPATVIALTAGWLFTAISCSVCWLFYCFCAPRTEVIPAAAAAEVQQQAEAPTAPTAPQLPIVAQFGQPVVQTALRWADGGTPAIRLPLTLTPRQFANQYDPYARWTIPEGLVAAR